MSELKDKKLYQKILSLQQPQQIKPKGFQAAFMVNVILKAIPLGLILFESVIAFIFNTKLLTQMVILFTVVEFWFTKNVTGKRMMGMRWFFDQDYYGNQRLKFQTRANPDYVDPSKKKLFWTVQIIYTILPLLFCIGLVFMIPTTFKIDYKKTIIYGLILASGLANSFYFWKAGQIAEERQNILKSKLGAQYVKSLGLGSITTHY